MGRLNINNETEPKNSKLLTMKILSTNGDIRLLARELQTTKLRGVKVRMLELQDKTIELKLQTTKPDIFAFLMRAARFSINNGIAFKAVFKDERNTLDWCGYYETNKTSTLEGSRFTNRVKLDSMLRAYFPIYI